MSDGQIFSEKEAPGWLLVLSFFCFSVAALWEGAVIVRICAWYLNDTFPFLAHVNVFQWAAIGLIIPLLRGYGAGGGEPATVVSVWKAISTAFLLPLFSLLSAFVWRLFL
jgi:hypothetical protein